jgi:SAM-dependent methyltransferase
MPILSPATWAVMVQPWDLVAGPLVRRITELLDLAPGQDVVSIGGGEGRFAVWLATRRRLVVEVVDPDPAAVARGEQAAARMPRLERPRFQVGHAADLPHESGVFDAAVLDLFTLGPIAAGRAFAEAARVLRPFGRLVLLAPAWHTEPDPDLERGLGEAFGLSAMMPVEWKRLLRGAGFVEITAEDWSAEPGDLPGRWPVALRGWRVAGLAGLRAALSPAGTSFLRELGSRRLAITLFHAVRWPGGGS